MKCKIIHIAPLVPAYEFYLNEPCPPITWNTPGGQWLGVWEREWFHQLSREILKIDKNFDFEVWQPDLRADKVYSHTFADRLIHRSFPAQRRKKIYGVKLINTVKSCALTSELLRLCKRERTYIHLHGCFNDITNSIIANLQNAPIVFSFYGEINLPSVRFFAPTWNLPSKFVLFAQHLWLKKYINKIDFITYMNDKHLSHLLNIYSGKVKKLSMGCDFSFWTKISQERCRRKLGLPRNKFIMITTASFRDIKQIDKFIETLTSISKRYNFLYILAGHGTGEYERYLKKIALPLIEQKKIFFTGYLKMDELLEYLNSADLFVSTSCSEGSSVSVMEAFACCLPVFSTNVGGTSEFMLREGAGCLVGIKDCEGWRQRLEDIISNGKLPEVINTEAARNLYDWGNVAKRFIAIYKAIGK